MTTIFSGAKHERAEAVTEDLEEVYESIAEFRKAKEEMVRLGFTDYDCPLIICILWKKDRKGKRIWRCKDKDIGEHFQCSPTNKIYLYDLLT